MADSGWIGTTHIQHIAKAHKLRTVKLPLHK